MTLIGTATFKVHEPGHVVRRYTFTCTAACAHRTLSRLHEALPDGGLIDMQWWDYEGNPAAGGSIGRYKHIVEIMPAPPSSVWVRMGGRGETVTTMSDDRGNVYAPFAADDTIKHLFNRAGV